MNFDGQQADEIKQVTNSDKSILCIKKSKKYNSDIDNYRSNCNEEPLVSIISPCFNGEKYVRNFLESVLIQTYRNIELIVINDGSTDGTSAILEEYKAHFKSEDIKYHIIYQENGGQASAINKGLKIFTGEFMMWMDSDDILLSIAVEEKIEFLLKNKDCGFVLCEGDMVNSDDLNKAIGVLRRVVPEGNDDLFLDLLTENNVVFVPGTIMVRTSAFLQSIPERHIYESREGQNWQLMLPMAYEQKWGYIRKSLFKCVIHSDSHSRASRGLPELIARRQQFEILQRETISSIKSMPDDEKQCWYKKIHEIQIRKCINFCNRSSNYEISKQYIKELKSLDLPIKVVERPIIWKIKKILKSILNGFRKK